MRLLTKSLIVFAPSYAIACDCLRHDHGIDPRHPALEFVDRTHKLRGRASRQLAVMVIDPLAKRSLDEDGEIYRLRENGIIRDWTADEIAAVSLPGTAGAL